LTNGDRFGVWGLGVWPLVVAVIGLALIWRQADQGEAAVAGTPAERTLRTRVVSVVRVLVGIGLLVVGVVGFLAAQGELSRALEGFVGTIVIVAGLVLIAWPWLWKLLRTVRAER